MPLRRRLWLSYVRAAILPLLVIEIGFLAIYWGSNAIVHRENVASIGAVSHQFLSDVARREANAIGGELAGYAARTDLLARQARRALDRNHAPSPAERARHTFDRDGSIYTTRDIGTTAGFYSNRTRPDRQKLERMLRLGAIDPLMIDIKRDTPAVMSVYFNSADSYNRIYPYIDAASQYPHDMDIPSYNFYYQADARHDPQRKPVWTDAYIDPAGHGWMISSIAPVWRGDRLEGVVGLDIGLKAIIDRLMGMDLPWGAYALLVDRSGRIIALPPAGEQDFGLRELTGHRYAEAIQQDSFKPDSFNIALRPDTRALAEAMRKGDSGDAQLRFDGPHHASFATVPGPGWRLVVIAPASAINAAADALRGRLRAVSYAMLAALVVFYAAFFLALWRRARRMSADLARPLDDLSALMARIGAGEHRQTFAGADIAELDRLGHDLVAMGNRLGDAHERIVEHEQAVRQALARQRQINEQQARLVQVMSHELRTPLAVVDSGAQILERKAETLAPADLRRRSERMRGAVRRIAELIDKLVASLAPDESGGRAGAAGARAVNLAEAVRAAGAAFASQRIAIGPLEPIAGLAQPEALRHALDSLLDNALRYSGQAGQVTIRLKAEEDRAVIEVDDDGPGLPDEELDEVGKPFFRGRNAAGTPGAGVNLHLAARYLGETGGRLDLARAPGGGLRARIVLPRAAMEAGS